MKKHGRFLTAMILAVSLLIFSGCELLKTQPVSPTTQPAPKVDKVSEVAGTVAQVATTVATVSPPGSPIQGGAAIVAGIAGLVVSGNEILKKLFAKKPPN